MHARWAAVFGFSLGLLACSGETPVVPRALLGRWVCADARYAGRSLSISQRSLLFAEDRTRSENFAVSGVESHLLPDGSTDITIAYGNEEADGRSLRVQLFPTAPPSLQIGDRAERWTLAPARGAMP